MIKFFYSTAPNPMKVALCLEEMGLAYEPIPVDTRKGDQHKPAYLAINPNAKVPAIVDGDVTMFDSNAIVLYLAEKTGKFLPKKAQERGPMLSWLMFVASGIGPFTGQYVHFKNYAPEKIAYALNRYEFEALRHWGIADAHLAWYQVSGDPASVTAIARAWGWFLGENRLGEPLIDIETGAGFDGLGTRNVNRNRGAESTIAVHRCAMAYAAVRASAKVSG